MMWATCKTHVRLAVRSGWLLGVMLLCMLLLAVLSETGARGSGGFAHAFNKQGLITPLFLIGHILAVVAQSERQNAAEELTESFPYDARVYVGGQLLATYLVWLFAGTLLWGVGVVLFVLRWELPLEPVVLLGGWARLLPVTLLFTTSVGCAVSLSQKRGYAAYLIAGAILMAGLILPGFLRTSGGWPSVLDLALHAYFPLTPWGSFPLGAILVWNRLFTLSLGLLVACGAIYRVAQRRGERSTLSLSHLRKLLLVAIIGSFVGSGLSWSGLTRQWGVEGPRPIASWASRRESTPPIEIGGYDLFITLEPEDRKLLGEAVLDVQSKTQRIDLFLNYHFRVTSVTGPDQNPVPFTQTSHTLLIETGGRTGEYRISYEGSVWQWVSGIGWAQALAAHVAPQGVMLPENMGWYPEPGRSSAGADRDLMRLNFGMIRERSWHQPVSIRLHAREEAGLHLISNADGQIPRRGVWLLASPWTPIETEHFELFVSPMNRSLAEEFGRSFADEVAFYNTLVPATGPVRLVEVPDSLHYVRWKHFPPAEFAEAMILPTTTLPSQKSGYYSNILRTHLLVKWWGHARTDQEQWAFVVLASFMAFLNERELFLPEIWQEEVDAEVAKLIEFHERYGMEATQRLLRRLRDSETPISLDLVAQLLITEGGRR